VGARLDTHFGGAIRPTHGAAASMQWTRSRCARREDKSDLSQKRVVRVCSQKIRWWAHRSVTAAPHNLILHTISSRPRIVMATIKNFFTPLAAMKSSMPTSKPPRGKKRGPSKTPSPPPEKKSNKGPKKGSHKDTRRWEAASLKSTHNGHDYTHEIPEEIQVAGKTVSTSDMSTTAMMVFLGIAGIEPPPPADKTSMSHRFMHPSSAPWKKGRELFWSVHCMHVLRDGRQFPRSTCTDRHVSLCWLLFSRVVPPVAGVDITARLCGVGLHDVIELKTWEKSGTLHRIPQALFNPNVNEYFVFHYVWVSKDSNVVKIVKSVRHWWEV
jgi:hypothetical protein